MSDLMYPNNTEHFDFLHEPEDQKNARKKEESKATAAVPILKELIAKLGDDIQEFESTNAIKVDAQTQTEVYLRELFAVQAKLNYAKAQKEYIETLIPESLR